MEINLTEIEKWENKMKQQIKDNPIRTVNQRIMKICGECDMVFENKTRHMHTKIKYTIMRCMQCKYCEQYFNMISCTCKALLCGNATLPEYESHKRHTIRCESCERHLILKKEDFSKHNWEIYEDHKAGIHKFYTEEIYN